MTKKIEVLHDEVIHTWEYLITQNRMFKKDGEIHPYEMVTRNNVDKIIAVIPITEDNEIILTKEFRIPLGKSWEYTIGIPAGLWDKEWEDGVDIVKRELLEETWYASDDIRYSFTTGTSEGMTDEKIDCYIALNCKKVSETLDLDPAEDIEVIKKPISEVHEYIMKQIANGVIVGSKFLSLMYMFEHFKK